MGKKNQKKSLKIRHWCLEKMVPVCREVSSCFLLVPILLRITNCTKSSTTSMFQARCFRVRIPSYTSFVSRSSPFSAHRRRVKPKAHQISFFFHLYIHRLRKKIPFGFKAFPVPTTREKVPLLSLRPL